MLDPARTRALNSLLMLKFSLEEAPPSEATERELDLWVCTVSQALPRGGGGVNAWISLISVMCSSSSSDPWVVEPMIVVGLLFMACF